MFKNVFRNLGRTSEIGAGVGTAYTYGESGKRSDLYYIDSDLQTYELPKGIKETAVVKKVLRTFLTVTIDGFKKITTFRILPNSAVMRFSNFVSTKILVLQNWRISKELLLIESNEIMWHGIKSFEVTFEC